MKILDSISLAATVALLSPVQASPYLAHRFSFNGDLSDSIGNIKPTATGHSFIASGTGQAVKLSGGAKGTSYVSFGENVIPTNGVSATIELWATLDTASNYARIFETGFNNSNGYLTGMAWQRSGANTDYVFVNHGKSNNSSAVNSLSPYVEGVQYHLAMVFVPCDNGSWTVRAYKQDSSTGTTLAKAVFTAPANWTFPKQYQKYFYLGHTYASGDNDAAATYDELRIWTRALSERELSESARRGPDAEIADGAFPFGKMTFDSSKETIVEVNLSTTDGIDKLGDGILALSGANEMKNGLVVYDGSVHQSGGSLTVSNAMVQVGNYDEKSSGRLVASNGARLDVAAVYGRTTNTDGLHSELLLNGATMRPTASDLSCFGAKLVHRWSFNGDLSDSVGNQTATTNGACSYSMDGKAVKLAGGNYGASYVDLGANILPTDTNAVTIEIWARQDEVKNWSRIFEIGINQYYFANMCWTRQTYSNQDYVEVKHNNTGKAAMDALKPYTPGTEFHIAITYYEDTNGVWKATAYKQDATTGATLAKTTFEGPAGWTLATMYQTYCYLGHSIVSGGSDASATYNEVRVWRGALTEEELTASAISGPDAPAVFIGGMTDVAIIGDGATIDTAGHNVTIDSPVSSACGDALVHRWSFNGDLSDSVGNQTAMTNGACSYSMDGKAVKLAGGNYGASYVNLGANILPTDTNAVTIEIWARQDEVKNWSRIFEIGINQYYFANMCWTRQTYINQDSIEVKHNNTGKAATDALKPYTLGKEFHIAITYYEGTNGVWMATAYKQDAMTGATLAKTTFEGPTGWTLATMYQTYCYLGHAVVSGGNDAAATYNEVRVWRGALTEEQLTRNAILGPDASFSSSGASTLMKTGEGKLTLRDVTTVNGSIIVAGGVLNLESSAAISPAATIGFMPDGNGNYGQLACAQGPLDLSGLVFHVSGTPMERTCLVTCADGLIGKPAKAQLPKGYAIVVSPTAANMVFKGLTLHFH